MRLCLLNALLLLGEGTFTSVRFYSEVTRESAAQLIDRLSEAEGEPIRLHVNSKGGSLVDGLLLYDVLREVPNLHTHVEGIAASAGTLLVAAGERRTMLPHSFFLVHQPSVSLEGERKLARMRDELSNVDACLNALIDVYLSRSRLNEDQLRALLSHDRYLSADEAVKMGFADQVLSP